MFIEEAGSPKSNIIDAYVVKGADVGTGGAIVDVVLVRVGVVILGFIVLVKASTIVDNVGRAVEVVVDVDGNIVVVVVEGVVVDVVGGVVDVVVVVDVDVVICGVVSVLGVNVAKVDVVP